MDNDIEEKYQIYLTKAKNEINPIFKITVKAREFLITFIKEMVDRILQDSNKRMLNDEKYSKLNEIRCNHIACSVWYDNVFGELSKHAVAQGLYFAHYKKSDVLHPDLIYKYIKDSNLFPSMIGDYLTWFISGIINYLIGELLEMAVMEHNWRKCQTGILSFRLFQGVILKDDDFQKMVYWDILPCLHQFKDLIPDGRQDMFVKEEELEQDAKERREKESGGADHDYVFGNYNYRDDQDHDYDLVETDEYDGESSSEEEEEEDFNNYNNGYGNYKSKSYKDYNYREWYQIMKDSDGYHDLCNLGIEKCSAKKAFLAWVDKYGWESVEDCKINN